MRLLLIRPGALGDTLLTFPVIEALRTDLPNSHITLVGNKAVLPLAHAFGLAEEVFNYEDPLWSGLFATPPSNFATNYVNEQKNRNAQPSAGTDLSCPPPSTAGTDLSCPPPSTAGTDLSCPGNGLQGGSPDTINRSLRDSRYSTQKERNHSLYSILHGTDRAIAWLSDPDTIVYQNLQAAGIPHVTVVPGRPPVQERVHIIDYLACSVGVSPNPHPRYSNCSSVTDNNAPGQVRAFAIHPGSGGARKCWPPERFAAVIRRLWQQGWPVLLLSGPADHERLDVLLKLLPAPPEPSLLKVLIDVPLLDLVPVLCQCRGYLGNDAGMTHLAALLGLPTLALFGPSDPLIWQPRGRAVSIIHPPNLEQLEVDTVIERIFTF